MSHLEFSNNLNLDFFTPQYVIYSGLHTVYRCTLTGKRILILKLGHFTLQLWKPTKLLSIHGFLPECFLT